MSNETLAYIPDGYTRTAYIGEIKHLYPAVRFTYRPIGTQERAFIYDRITRCPDPRKAEAMAAQAVSKYVADWDITGGDGQSVALQESHILRLQPRLMQRIYRIIMGDDGGDDDPDQSDAERDAGTDRDWQEMMAGSTAEAESQDAKNFEAG